jgi:ATP-dependent protease ClpP protease subunit
MKDDIAFSERLNKKIEDLYVARTKVKRGEFRRKSQKTEWWIEAPEAVELGIAHAIG